MIALNALTASAGVRHICVFDSQRTYIRIYTPPSQEIGNTLITDVAHCFAVQAAHRRAGAVSSSPSPLSQGAKIFGG